MERLQLFVTGVILSLFLFFIPVFGGEITIGTETNQNHLPMNPYFVYSYTQSIYLQEEIGQTGQIVAIKYRYNNYDTWTDDIVVYMGTTDKTTFEGSSDWIPLTSLTEVYSGSFIVNTTDEWVTITFDTPFNYDNTHNLVVAFDENSSGYHSSNDYFYCTYLDSSRSIYYRSDYTNPDPASPPDPASNVSLYIANIILVINTGSASLPTVTTTTATLITQTTATSGGDVTSDGGATVTAKGVCWSINSNPTIADSKINDGDGTGSFVSYITGLTNNTTYYVRAYATNSEGTAYGNEISFTTSGELPEGVIADIDGNEYDTVRIGNQTWMVQNLRVSKFNNGDVITNMQDATEWGNQFANPLWCNYSNNVDNDLIYGKIYNAAVVIDDRNVCPDGWHVPGLDEWNMLVDYLGGSALAGSKLKEIGTTHWNSLNSDATNETGFTALPGGYRDGFGDYINIGNYAHYWLSDIYSTYFTYYFYMNYNWGYAYSDYTSNGNGKSIRCIKDTLVQTSLPTVTTTTVTEIAQTTATGGGNVTSDGGATIIAKGVCWSTSSNPTTADSKTTDGDGTGSFVSSLTGLTANTTYYVRAYATNSAGTAYGAEVSFTTPGGTTEQDYASLPLSESFDNTWIDKNDTRDVPSVYWKNTPATGDDSWRRSDDGYASGGWYSNSGAYSPLGANSSSQSARFHSYNASNGETGILDLYIDFSTQAGEKELSFYYINPTGTDFLTIYVSTDGGSTFGTGVFHQMAASTWEYKTVNMGNLISNSVVIRFEAVSDWGADDIGLDEISITTSGEASLPTVITAEITNITQTTATGGGNVTSDGGATVTARGICWSTSENPTTADSKTNLSDGTGIFTDNITGLTANTTYYVRAYATNSEGTAYGNEVSFSTLQASSVGKISDIDGNEYDTVRIGNQTWFAENLRVSKFNNGDAITNMQDATEWGNQFASPLWCNYSNNADNDAVYGKIYNAAVVIDDRNVCPDGWHVPSLDEWNTLVDYLGGSALAGSKLKEVGTTHWNSPNSDATNETGFTAVPGGYRDGFGDYINIGNYAHYWLTTANSAYYTYYFYMNFNWGNAYSDYTSNGNGKSIRCIKDTLVQTSLPTLTTTAITAISQTTATGGGNVTFDGNDPVVSKGVCWSTSPNPTISNPNTVDGTGIGSYSSSLTGLTANTTYYVRAFAINDLGVGYGDQVSFTTLNQSGSLTAAFSADVTTGNAPLTVNFTDESTEGATAWAWDFNNDGTTDANTQNASYQYSNAGTYTVKLTVSNGTSTDDEIKINYITVNTSISEIGWYIQDETTTDKELNAVFFINGNTGWAIGEQVLLKTTNGGENWNSTAMSSYYLEDVYFINENTGFIVGGCSSCGGEIYKTTNGGENWTQKTSGTTANLYSVFFIDENTGWAAGSGESAGVILKTTDGGENWDIQTNSVNKLRDIFFIDADHGWASGNNGYIYRTTDGGTNWISEHTSSYYIYSVSFIDTNYGYAVGMQGDVFKTRDGGDTWTDQTSGTDYYLETVCFIDTNIGWAAGTNLYETDAVILKTQNGGKTWHAQKEIEGKIHSLIAIDDDLAWAVGDEGVILHTIDGGGEIVETITAAFTASPVFETVPLEVFFTDQSIGDITSWNWNFGDGATSNEQNPSHVYTTAGGYTVTLIVSDGTSNDTLIRADLIQAIAGPEPLNAEFSANITSGNMPLLVSFTDQSTGDPVSWSWDFNNDGTIDATDQNPSYIFYEEGIYTVVLTVSDGTDTDTETKTSYITVTTIENINNNILSSSVSIFPNPGNGTIYLAIDYSFDLISCQVITVTGSIIFESMISTSGIHEINLSDYGKGIYFLKLVDNENTRIEKLIIK